MSDASDKPDMVAVEERWRIGHDGKPDFHEVRVMDTNDKPVRHRRLCRVNRGGSCNCFPLADGETEEAASDRPSPGPWAAGGHGEIVDATGRPIHTLPRLSPADAALIAAAPETKRELDEALGLLAEAFDAPPDFDDEADQSLVSRGSPLHLRVLEFLGRGRKP